MKKKLISIGLIVCLSLCIFTGCGNKNQGLDPDKYTVRIATMTTGFTLSLHYANKSGIFEDLGLQVNEAYFESGPAINEAIAAGDIDVGGIGEMPSITGALANNTKVVAWMEDDESSIQAYARNDSDIVAEGKGNLDGFPDIYGTAETWKGKDIICAKGTSSHYGLLATLDAFGLTESDVNIINMEGSTGAAAFTSGTGDIFFGFDPQWAGMFNNTEEYTCISTCKATGNSLFCFLIASEDFADNHPEELTKVIQGIMLAGEEFRNDSDKYAEEMLNWQGTFGGTSEELAAFSASLKPFRTWKQQAKLFETNENGTTDILDSMLVVAQFMVNNNLIEASDIDRLKELDAVRPEYMQQAIENLRDK